MNKKQSFIPPSLFSSSHSPCRIFSAFPPSSLLILLFLVWGMSVANSSKALAQSEKSTPQAGSAAANRQFAAAAALQNREEYALAGDEWSAFLKNHPQDARADQAQHYLGLCLLKTEKYPQALEAFALVLKNYPKSTTLEGTYLYLGIAQYRLGRAGQKENLVRAEESFATLIAKFPQGKQTAQALFFRGESLYALDRKDQALAQYQQLLAKFPQDPLAPDALYALGVSQQELGQSQAAHDSLAKFLQQYPEHALAAEVGLRQGETLFTLGNFAEAEKRFAAAAKGVNFPLADLALLRRGASLYELKQYQGAAEQFVALEKQFPQSTYLTEARLAGGKCALLSGDLPKAQQTLLPLVSQAGPQAIEAAHWLARVHLKQNQPGEALALTEKWLPQAKNHPLAVALEMDRAEALHETPQRRKDSINAFAQLAQAHPEDPLAPQAWYMAAFAGLEEKDFAGALKSTEQYLQKYASHELAPDVRYIAAESRLQLGQFAEAAQLYAQLLEKHPQHTDAMLWNVRLGLCLYSQKNFSECMKTLAPIAGKQLSPELAAETYRLLGGCRQALGQFEQAVGDYEKFLAAAGQGTPVDEILLALADSLRQSGKLPQARERLSQLIMRYPQSSFLDQAYFRLGELTYGEGNYDEAAKQYQTLLETFPKSPLSLQARYGLGWTQLAQGNHAGAVETLSLVLQGNPPAELASRSRYARALARQQLQQFAPAVEDLRAYLSGNPPASEKSDALYVLALCEAGNKHPAEAEKILTGLLQEDPKYPSRDKALYELAWAKQNQNKGEEAVKTFAQLAQEHPQSPLAGESLYRSGEYYYEKEDFPAAAKAYYEAIEKTGKTELGEKVSHKLGWTYFRQGFFDKAQQQFAYQKAIFPQGPLIGDAIFMEAEAFFKQNNFAEALKLYTQVSKPTGQDFAPLALLHAGQSAAQLQDFNQSLALLQKASKEFPQSSYLPEILYEQAWALQNLGQSDKAIPIYESVTEKTDREIAARARFMIGEVYFQQKNHAEAVRQFFKVAYGYAYPHWQAEAHFEAARCFEVLKKNDQAVKSYQELVDKFGDSPRAAPARERLRELLK